jgi:hypothetical protein
MHPNVILSRGSQVRSLEIFEIGTPVTLEVDNFLCRPPIEIRFEEKLYPLSRKFLWYKELFNPMSFELWNFPLKIWESIGTPTPKMKTHLGVWGFIPSHSPTFLGAWNVTPRLHSWPTPLQAFALVVSPKLKLHNNHYFHTTCPFFQAKGYMTFQMTSCVVIH